MPKVSIVILTYNSKAYLENLLSSIKKQSYKNYEVIVVDNASTDKTISYVKDNYSDVKIIENSENYWFSKGNNIGIKQAQGDYILICNHDVKLASDCLQHLVKRIEKSQCTGAVTGKVFKLTKASNSAILDGVGIKRTFYRQFVNIGENEVDNGQFNEAKQVFGVSGALFLIRSKALEDIAYKGEYFDEDFVAYKEDIDLSYRLHSAGWNIVYEPDAVAWHERGVQAGSILLRKNKNKLIRAYSYRNHWWVILKNEPVVNLIVFGPFIFIYECLKFIYILMFEFNSLKFCINSLKDLSKIIAKRK